jgi:hypothetical protein
LHVVLLGKGYVAKVADFGMSRVTSSFASVGETQSGVGMYYELYSVPILIVFPFRAIEMDESRSNS